MNNEMTPIPALVHFPKEAETTGTTLVACETSTGIVIGTDSRTSTGNFISSRVTDKITVLNDSIVLLRAGSAADSQAMADIIIYLSELKSIQDEEPLTVYDVAQYARKFHYNYREQLNCVVIVGGYDEFKQGQIYSVNMGGYTTRQPIYSSGSGSSIIHGYLDVNWKEGMSMEEAKKMVSTAVFLAQYHDGASGGVINLATIDKNGTQKMILRPDKPNFPTLPKLPAYPNLPEHIPQSGFIQKKAQECEE